MCMAAIPIPCRSCSKWIASLCFITIILPWIRFRRCVSLSLSLSLLKAYVRKPNDIGNIEHGDDRRQCGCSKTIAEVPIIHLWMAQHFAKRRDCYFSVVVWRSFSILLCVVFVVRFPVVFCVCVIVCRHQKGFKLHIYFLIKWVKVFEDTFCSESEKLMRVWKCKWNPLRNRKHFCMAASF